MKGVRGFAQQAARAAVVMLLGLNDCGLGGDGEYECTDEHECVEWSQRNTGEALHTFSDDCIGSTCAVSAPRGGVSSGESFHPALRALHIRAGAVAFTAMTVRGIADGAVVSVNAHCTDGATLSVSDDVSAIPGPLALTGPTAWRRVARVMRTASVRHDQNEYGLQTTVTVGLSVTGEGECAVDRLRYTHNALLCSRTVVWTHCTRVPGDDPFDASLANDIAEEPIVADDVVDDPLFAHDVPPPRDHGADDASPLDAGDASDLDAMQGDTSEDADEGSDADGGDGADASDSNDASRVDGVSDASLDRASGDS